MNKEPTRCQQLTYRIHFLLKFHMHILSRIHYSHSLDVGKKGLVSKVRHYFKG